MNNGFDSHDMLERMNTHPIYSIDQQTNPTKISRKNKYAHQKKLILDVNQLIRGVPNQS